MRRDARIARQRDIERACLEVLASNGYAGMSMLAVARRANASNETLYRWYGDKSGLLGAIVRRNAQESAQVLADAGAGDGSALAALERVAPILLAMVTGESAIALNRAAAADETGTLGRIIAEGGRERILPLLCAIMERAVREGSIAPGRPIEAAELFVTLLIGDLQVRRVIRALPELSPEEVERRSRLAMHRFLLLLNPEPGGAGSGRG